MFVWLLRGVLKAETESDVIATQDQALQKKYHATKILQTETCSKCRPCQQCDEAVDHIYQHAQYWQETGCALHFTLTCVYKEIGVKLDSEHWYEHVPKLV
jgi:NADH:ubiquinone oxidoreductase subunit F (NADH-binding)